MKRLLLLGTWLLMTGFGWGQIPTGFTKIASTTTPTYTDATCANSTACFYIVTATDAAGHESAPATCAVGQLCFGGNQAQANMPSSGTHTVQLTWTSSATGFNVYQLPFLAPTSLQLVVH